MEKFSREVYEIVNFKIINLKVFGDAESGGSSGDVFCKSGSSHC